MAENKPDFLGYLTLRGLRETPARMHAEPCDYDGRPGFCYPVCTFTGMRASHRSGVPAMRWKGIDGKRPKYFWLNHNPHDGQPWDVPRYQFAPDFRRAVHAEGKQATLATGDMDLWTFIEAGEQRVFSLFGEGSVPPTFGEDLKSWGVEILHVFPDLDREGLGGALKAARLAAEAGVLPKLWRLPERLGEKGDTNALWAAEREVFWMELEIADPIPLPWEELNEVPREANWNDAQYQEFIDKAWAWIVADCGNPKFVGGIANVKGGCRIAHHEHDKEEGASKAYLYDYDAHTKAYKCFKCAANGLDSLNIVEYLAKRDKNPVEFYPRLAASLIQPPHNGVDKPEHTSALVGWPQASQEYEDLLHGKLDFDHAFPALPIPFKDCRRYGGQAKAISPGEFMVLISGTGWGKTVFTSALANHWRRLGYDGIVWGPEWKPVSYVAKTVQGLGGPTVDEIKAHKTYLIDMKRGLRPEQSYGQELSTDQIKIGSSLRGHIDSWPGHLHWVDKGEVTPLELMDHFRESYVAHQALGRRLAFAVLDYKNLLMPEKGMGMIEMIALTSTLFKGFCMTYNVVGIEVTQPDKPSAQLALNGGRITLESALGGRTFGANLVITLTREFDEDGNMLPLGRFLVAKNSEGGAGPFDLWFDNRRAIWLDTDEKPLEEPTANVTHYTDKQAAEPPDSE